MRKHIRIKKKKWIKQEFIDLRNSNETYTIKLIRIVSHDNSILVYSTNKNKAYQLKEEKKERKKRDKKYKYNQKVFKKSGRSLYIDPEFR